MKRLKFEINILLPLIIFMFLSIISIYSATTYLPNYLKDLYLKQLIFYFLGFILAIIILLKGNELIVKNIWFLYLGINLLLVALLFFGIDINGSKSWIIIGDYISFQPSEFMKIVLILSLASILEKDDQSKSKKTLINEFKLILKVLLVLLIPSILTFLQPDTGAVIIYFVIAIFMLFVKGIKLRWFTYFLGVIGLMVGSVLIVYFVDKDLFIKILGTNFFYRLDRLFNWTQGSGMQLENSLLAISGAGFLGFGFNKTPIYFPEPQTDFIFSTYASNFGFMGAIFLLVLIIYFLVNLINLTKRKNNNFNKYVIFGIVGMLSYQQIQNIGMTIGLLPITGITLPFISYGGSSLLSYMILVGLVFNIAYEANYYHN